MKYKEHCFPQKMTQDQANWERLLNSLEVEVLTIIPNIKPAFRLMGAMASVDFLLFIEKVG